MDGITSEACLATRSLKGNLLSKGSGHSTVCGGDLCLSHNHIPSPMLFFGKSVGFATYCYGKEVNVYSGRSLKRGLKQFTMPREPKP